MTIVTAKCITDEDEKLITAQEIISKEDYQENYQGHLYCAEENCNAVIVYVNEKPPFFRTWPNSEHYINCKFHSSKEKTRSSSRNGEEITGSLTPDQIKSKFASAIHKYTPNPNPKKRMRLINNTKQSRKKTENSNVLYQIDPNAPPIEDMNKKSRGKIVRCEDLSINDINNQITLYGFIDEIIFSDNEVLFNLKCKNSNKVVLQFYNAFKEKSLQDWNNLKYIKEYFDMNATEISVYFIGNVKIVNERFILQVMASDLLLLNKLNYSSFINKITNYSL